MILLDENITEDQCQLLRKWRFRIRQIGQGVGLQGMKDEEQIVPLLHKLDRPTFFTRDWGFFDRNRCHNGYCLVYLDASPEGCSSHGKTRFASSFLEHQGEANGGGHSRGPDRPHSVAFACRRSGTTALEAETVDAM
jgi:hypothetical protein